MGRASTELARGGSWRVWIDRVGIRYSRTEERLPRLGVHEAEYGLGHNPGRHHPCDVVLGKDRYAAPLLRCGAFDSDHRTGSVDLGRVLFWVESWD